MKERIWTLNFFVGNTKKYQLTTKLDHFEDATIGYHGVYFQQIDPFVLDCDIFKKKKIMWILMERNNKLATIAWNIVRRMKYEFCLSQIYSSQLLARAITDTMVTLLY